MVPGFGCFEEGGCEGGAVEDFRYWVDSCGVDKIQFEDL